MSKQTSEAIIRRAVRERYSKLALKTDCCRDDCCSDSSRGKLQASIVPAEAAQVAAGCGSPLSYANVTRGQTVVDLGSGGGIDVFRAARLVEPQGRVIGIDSTPEMIWRARETASKNGYKNVEFRLGEIEHIPLESNFADFVISNCVINLAPDKEAVFRDAFRVLKPVGELVVSDIVAEKPIPAAARKLMTGWAACLTGAIPESEYLQSLSKAGFEETRILERRSGMHFKLIGAFSAERLKLASLTIAARKPSDGQT